MEYLTISKADKVQIVIKILMILDFVIQTRFLRGNVTATILLTLLIQVYLYSGLLTTLTLHMKIKQRIQNAIQS